MKNLKLLCLAVLFLGLLIQGALALEPVVFDLVMQAGEDFTLPVRLDFCADNPLPQPPALCKSWKVTDLTGYTYKAQFLSAPAPAGTVYATYSCIFTNITGGELKVKLSKAQTTANSGRSGIWDLRQTDSGGAVSYIIRGKAVVSPTGTR